MPPTTNPTVEHSHTNSVNETITVELVTGGQFVDHFILVIHDDPPPLGAGITAPMLLDRGTRDWLRMVLAEFDDDEE